MALDDFKGEVREFLETHCPKSMRKPMREENDYYWGGRNASFKNAEQEQWFHVMADKGWTTPAWPKAYGGGGLSKPEANVLRKEMQKMGCRPPLMSFGIWMLGPALLQFGSEEQRLEHIPEIVQGKIRWCQGYSEPGAGRLQHNLMAITTSSMGRRFGPHMLIRLIRSLRWYVQMEVVRNK